MEYTYIILFGIRAAGPFFPDFLPANPVNLPRPVYLPFRSIFLVRDYHLHAGILNLLFQ